MTKLFKEYWGENNVKNFSSCTNQISPIPNNTREIPNFFVHLTYTIHSSPLFSILTIHSSSHSICKWGISSFSRSPLCTLATLCLSSPLIVICAATFVVRCHGHILISYKYFFFTMWLNSILMTHWIVDPYGSYRLRIYMTHTDYWSVSLLNFL